MVSQKEVANASDIHRLKTPQRTKDAQTNHEDTKLLETDSFSNNAETNSIQIVHDLWYQMCSNHTFLLQT